MEKKQRRRQKGEGRTHNIALRGRVTVNSKRTELALFSTNIYSSSVFGHLSLMPPDRSTGASPGKQLRDQVGRHLSSHNTFLPVCSSVPTQVSFCQQLLFSAPKSSTQPHHQLSKHPSVQPTTRAIAFDFNPCEPPACRKTGSNHLVFTSVNSSVGCHRQPRGPASSIRAVARNRPKDRRGQP